MLDLPKNQVNNSIYLYIPIADLCDKFCQQRDEL